MWKSPRLNLRMTLARANLLASICFFKEGLVYLYKVLDLKAIEADIKFTEQGAEGKQKNSDQSLRPSQAASVKTVSLANEMRSLQVTEQNEFTRKALANAKDRFKRAREKATEAFCNEALGTSDRILAMQYRVMATLLEEIDNPVETLAACRLCLEELHSMPAVQKSFNVHLKQGLRSWFNQAEREEIICSVCRVNRVIFNVMQMVGGDVNLSLWPCVDIGEENVDPLRDGRVTSLQRDEDMEHSLLKPWSPLVQEGEAEKVVWGITTNTRGQFITVGRVSDVSYLEVFNCTGKQLHCYRLPLSTNESRVFMNDILIDTDRENNVFILVNWSSFKNDVKSVWSTVHLFDEHATLKHEFNLEEGSEGSSITVNVNNKVFVAIRKDHRSYSGAKEIQVYDTNGLFLHSFEEGTLTRVIDITATNSVDGRIIVFQAGPSVHLFSELGHHLSRFNFRDSEGYHVGCIASHRTSKHVFVLLQNYLFCPYRCIFPRMLYIFTLDGEFLRSIHLYAKWQNHYKSKQGAIVTKEGLVAMPARERRTLTGKEMIVVL